MNGTTFFHVLFLLLFIMFSFSMNQGWGIQTNIFETNILNLAVVLAIVIFFVGDAVQSLLEKRQQSILSNLQQAQQRAEESERLFIAAQEKFRQASSQVDEINLQTNQSIEQQKKQSQTQILADLQRLQEFQQSTIDSQQQKIQKQISQKMIFSSIQKVDQKFQKGFDRKTQKSVNALSIHLLQKIHLLGEF